MSPMLRQNGKARLAVFREVFRGIAQVGWSDRSPMTRAITATLAVASSMVQLRRAPKTAREWAEPFRVGLLLKGNFGLGLMDVLPFSRLAPF